MQAAREWSLSQLSQADKEYIESFQPTIRIEFPGNKALLCYHGSPKSFDDILMPDSPLQRFLELLPIKEATFFAGGHTHVQFVRQIGQGFHFNPGSAGFAYRHDQSEEAFMYDHFAEYAILEAEEDRFGLEFRRLPFDVDRLVSIYRTCGRPYPEESIAGYER
jgi:predicted phosphodiesterase